MPRDSVTRRPDEPSASDPSDGCPPDPPPVTPVWIACTLDGSAEVRALAVSPDPDWLALRVTDFLGTGDPVRIAVLVADPSFPVVLVVDEGEIRALGLFRLRTVGVPMQPIYADHVVERPLRIGVSMLRQHRDHAVESVGVWVERHSLPLDPARWPDAWVDTRIPDPI